MQVDDLLEPKSLLLRDAILIERKIVATGNLVQAADCAFFAINGGIDQTLHMGRYLAISSLLQREEDPDRGVSLDDVYQPVWRMAAHGIRDAGRGVLLRERGEEPLIAQRLESHLINGARPEKKTTLLACGEGLSG